MVIQVKLVKLSGQHRNKQHWFGLSFWDQNHTLWSELCPLVLQHMEKLPCYRMFLMLTYDELQNFKMTMVASKNGHLWRIPGRGFDPRDPLVLNSISSCGFSWFIIIESFCLLNYSYELIIKPMVNTTCLTFHFEHQIPWLGPHLHVLSCSDGAKQHVLIMNHLRMIWFFSHAISSWYSRYMPISCG